MQTVRSHTFTQCLRAVIMPLVMIVWLFFGFGNWANGCDMSMDAMPAQTIMGGQHSCCNQPMGSGMSHTTQDKDHLQSSCDCMITAATTTTAPVEVGFHYTLTASDFLPAGYVFTSKQPERQDRSGTRLHDPTDQLVSASPPLHLQHGVFLN